MEPHRIESMIYEKTEEEIGLGFFGRFQNERDLNECSCYW